MQEISYKTRKIIIDKWRRHYPVWRIAFFTAVSVSTIYRIIKRFRDTGVFAAKEYRHGRKQALDVFTLGMVRDLVLSEPSVTLADIKSRLKLPISESAICRILNGKLKLRRKKKQFMPAEALRAVNLEKRAEWEALMPRLDIMRLVFIDVCGVGCSLVNPYGRAEAGSRCTERIRDTRFESTSLVDAVRLNGNHAPMVFKGALNGRICLQWVERSLLGVLGKGDIVVMDNLSSHKVKGVREAIESVGATLLYLPPYSPDFNPIELVWGKIKAFLKKVQNETYDELVEAVGWSYSTISFFNVVAWFQHCGYSRS
jgi:transposase